MMPLMIRTLRGMVWDTFRQSLASRLFWGMITFTLIAVLLCLSVNVTGTERPRVYDAGGFLPAERGKQIRNPDVELIGGEVSIGFGLMAFEHKRYRDDAVRMIQLMLAGAAAGTVGVLLALLWTAGFLPGFLEPQSATVLLAKPTPRSVILVGKYLGVVLFVAVQTAIFIGGTWLAIGLKADVWSFTYWLAVPLLVINFAIFYSISTFLAVVTRSTIACAFGTLMVWFVCWLVNFTYLKQTITPSTTPASRSISQLCYWLAPKPFDLEGLFYAAMRAETFSQKDSLLEYAEAAGTVNPELSVLSSLAFAMLVLAAAVYEFKHTDY